VIIDEAGMADTRTLARVLAHVERAEGKAILVGDPAQLPAVGAGGLFAAIVERHGAFELFENRRQHDELERRALAALRAGVSGDYLAHAARHGRLVVAADPLAAKAALLADWWPAASDDLAGSMMIAYRRRDVGELNAVARSLMDEHGRLGADRLALADGRELAVGDRVVCARNNRRLGVSNGSRGTVSAVDPTAHAIELDVDDGLRVRLDGRYLDAGQVDYAYALTGHKTQGLTVERAFVLSHGDGNLKEWGYVALSRARRETRLYTTAAELEHDLPPGFQPEPPDAVDRLADALTRPAAESLALDDARDQPQERNGRADLIREARALAGRRQTFSDERAETARALDRLERELSALGVVGRLRRGGSLREQIAAKHESLSRLDRDLRELERHASDLQKRAARDGFRRAWERPERERTRERGRARAHEPVRALDLGR
jgi:hypothetical protein